MASRAPQPAPLKVDASKYPSLARNPALERALRIRLEMEKGRAREEAVRLADEAMGRPSPAAARPKPVGRPASGPRPGGAAERPRRKPATARRRRD